jgi:hypothetical protein
LRNLHLLRSLSHLPAHAPVLHVKLEFDASTTHDRRCLA